MSDFPSVLKTKIDEKGLSVVDAAAAIGVNLNSLRSALAGASFPNARSVGKYAGFLALGETEVKALIDSSKPAAGTKVKKEKPVKAPKPPKAPKKLKAAKTDKATAGKRGRKPGVKSVAMIGTKPSRQAGKAGSSKTSAALATVAAALKLAESLASDTLAVAVHQLSKAKRNVVESILKNLA